MGAQHTPGPWFVGCQNDALFIIAGRSPSLNNDYPWHDARRVALAKVFGPADGDCLPVNADANARLITAAPDMLEALEELHLKAVVGTDEERHAALNKAWSAIAKARGA